MKNQLVRTSKFLSLVLRHKPETIGIELDAQGWTSVSDLLQALSRSSHPLSLSELQEVVRSNDKQRFSFNEDQSRIRASQGHSLTIDLGYEEAVPPAILFHGTSERFLTSIRQQGLIKGQRHHVHLSTDTEVARNVGKRYGKPVVLSIASEQMNKDGHLFFRSANSVWLTERVPVEYIEFPAPQLDSH
jgi:putative RNA 2'-phosphotransferase